MYFGIGTGPNTRCKRKRKYPVLWTGCNLALIPIRFKRKESKSGDRVKAARPKIERPEVAQVF